MRLKPIFLYSKQLSGVFQHRSSPPRTHSEGWSISRGRSDSCHLNGSEEGEPAVTQEQQPPPQRKKNSKWIEYTQIAREELRNETGKQKVPQKDVFARARAYMIEDNWMKAPKE